MGEVGDALIEWGSDLVGDASAGDWRALGRDLNPMNHLTNTVNSTATTNGAYHQIQADTSSGGITSGEYRNVSDTLLQNKTLDWFFGYQPTSATTSKPSVNSPVGSAVSEVHQLSSKYSYANPGVSFTDQAKFSTLGDTNAYSGANTATYQVSASMDNSTQTNGQYQGMSTDAERYTRQSDLRRVHPNHLRGFQKHTEDRQRERTLRQGISNYNRQQQASALYKQPRPL